MRKIRKLRRMFISTICCLTFIGSLGTYVYKTKVAAKEALNTVQTVVAPITKDIPGKEISGKVESFVNTITPTPQPTQLTAVVVKRVVDGDTFVIDNGGEEIRVRLIGIDTPESVAPDEYLEKTGKQNTEAGKTASEFTKSLIEGKTVYLEFDASREDKYGRLLAYAYLEDGRMIQDILLQTGYAQLMTVPPNVKYSDHFVEVLNNSRY